MAPSRTRPPPTAFLAPASLPARGASLPVRVRACAAAPSTRRTFTLTRTVMPADTDYSSAMWHGAYVRWLEEARVAFLAGTGVAYDTLVRDDRTELVVASLEVRYVAAAKMGDVVNVHVRLAEGPGKRVRLPMESEFVRVKDGKVLAEALVTLAPIDADSGRLKRVWPQSLQDALSGLYE